MVLQTGTERHTKAPLGLKGVQRKPQNMPLICELEILKENLKLSEHQHFLVPFKNLHGSNQTLQAEMNCFKEGQAGAHCLTTNSTKGTCPLRRSEPQAGGQVGPSGRGQVSGIKMLQLGVRPLHCKPFQKEASHVRMQPRVQAYEQSELDPG